MVAVELKDDLVKNILLVTVDSLRFDDLQRSSVETTAIDALVDNGVAFERAFATGPGTTPSFPALLTGTMPLSYDGLGPLSEYRPRVSSNLSNAGFTTAGFHSNPFLSSHFAYDIGFDTFEDYQNPLMGIATKVFPRGIELDGSLNRLNEHLHLTDFLKWSYQKIRGKPRPYVPAEVITDDAKKWLENTDEPFLCWAHYMDVHQPCYPPAKYRERFGVGDVDQKTAAELYSRSISDPQSITDEERNTHRCLADAALAFTDAQVDRILNTLREQNRYKDTLVVFTSDHGHLYGDHKQFGKPEMLYEELLRIPLVVANGPDHLEFAQRDLVSLLDVPPLIFNALNLPIPKKFTGLRPGIDESRHHVIAEHEVEGEVIVGARSENWRYEHDQIRGERRLFDLNESCTGIQVDEKSIRSDDEIDRIRSAVAERLDSLDVDATGYDKIDENVQDRLTELGYF